MDCAFSFIFSSSLNRQRRSGRSAGWFGLSSTAVRTTFCYRTLRIWEDMCSPSSTVWSNGWSLSRHIKSTGPTFNWIGYTGRSIDLAGIHNWFSNRWTVIVYRRRWTRYNGRRIGGEGKLIMKFCNLLVPFTLAIFPGDSINELDRCPSAPHGMRKIRTRDDKFLGSGATNLHNRANAKNENLQTFVGSDGNQRWTDAVERYKS